MSDVARFFSLLGLALEETSDVDVAILAAEQAMTLTRDDVSLGMVGDEWHGPQPPGPDWVQTGQGPSGGKIWRRRGNFGGRGQQQSSQQSARTLLVKPPPDQGSMLLKVQRDARNRDLNDPMGASQGVSLPSGIPSQITDKFDAHATQTVQTLAALLNGGVDPGRQFFHAPLTSLGQSHQGIGLKGGMSFVVLSHPGQTIQDGGIPAVMVDQLHAPSIPDLSRAFPGVKFFPDRDASGILSKVSGVSLSLEGWSDPDAPPDPLTPPEPPSEPQPPIIVPTSTILEPLVVTGPEPSWRIRRRQEDGGRARTRRWTIRRRTHHSAVALGMVGDEWHGPRPPGTGWVQAGKGPRGGLIWKKQGGGAAAPAASQQQGNPKQETAIGSGVLAGKKLVLGGSDGKPINPERAKLLTRTLEGIVAEMPEAAQKLLAQNIESVCIFEDSEDVDRELIADHPQHAQTIKDAQGYAVASYSPLKKKLYLDRAYGGEVDGAYAHELGHALDGKFTLSYDSEWRTAWAQEVNVPATPLSHYGKSSMPEGLAEFSRLLYGEQRDLADVEARFPRCSAFFRRKGLWPSK